MKTLGDIKTVTLGNAIKAQVEIMIIMMQANRTEHAGKAYNRIISLCDQAGQPVKEEAKA
jgi:hypothetical protein|tara:strand:+ start:68 stop:247 length:180 start_codon:yes stop_codon:yes gene_type:complete